MEKITTPEQARAAIKSATIWNGSTMDTYRFIRIEKFGEIIEAAMQAAYDKGFNDADREPEEKNGLLWLEFDQLAKDLQQAQP